MLYTIIKNNFKLMFRNKMILVMILVVPILVIAALSSAFHGLLTSGYQAGEFSVGYYIEADCPIKMGEEVLIDTLQEQGIQVQEYTQNQMENAVKNGEVDVFLYCDSDGCQIAASDINSIEAKSIAYSMQQYARWYQIGAPVEVKAQELPFTPIAEATDYYGIIEIIYFLWICTILLTAVVQSERKNRIQQRFAIAPTSGITLYLGKFLPCVLLSIGTIGVSALAATFMFDIHWGNIPGTLGILFLLSLASTALGIVFLYMSKNLAVSAMSLFIFVWVGGFVGGSFETYMFSTIPESIKKLSPIYYVNRTVIEYSTMGHSDYTGGCILYLGAILLVCTAIGMLLMNRRMEEKG